MKNKAKKQAKNKAKKQAKNKVDLFIIPYIILGAIIPLVMQLRAITLDETRFRNWSGGNGVEFDIFSYVKMELILAMGVVIIIALILKLLMGEKLKERILEHKVFFIFMGIYALFTIFSTILSEYKSIALWGFVQQYEGMFVLLTYLLITLSIVLIIKNEFEVELIMKGILISGSVIAIIGIFQSFGMDFWETTLGTKIVMLTSSKNIVVNGNLPFQDMAYGTLFHKDYMGSYYAMLVPMSLGMLIFGKEKRTKLFYSVPFILSSVVLVLCKSRAGLMGAGVAFIVLIIYIFKNFSEYKKSIVIGIIGILVMVIGGNVVTKGKVMNIASQSTKEIVSAVGELFSSSSEDFKIEDHIELQQIRDDENLVGFSTKTEGILVTVQSGRVVFLDNAGQVIKSEFNSENGHFNLQDERYANYSAYLAKLKEENILIVSNGGIKFYYRITPYKISMIDTKGYKLNYGEIESIGFEGKERVGSSRGYIWARTLPLIKKKPIFGYGPGTFIAYFPQNDFKGKMYSYYDMWHLVDKPHNQYMQIAVNSGVIALIGYLGMLIVYLISCFKLYILRKIDSTNVAIGASVSVAIIGYIVAALINDSKISVAPVFWVLLGLGLVINNILKKKENVN